MTQRLTPRRRVLLAASLLVLASGAAPALAAGNDAAPGKVDQLPAGPAKVRVIGPDGTERSVAPVVQSDVERYCTNISDAAIDARNALQKSQMTEMESRIDAKIGELEKTREDVQVWLSERKAFMESTSTIMIDIYAAMKPDAAAAQLAGLKRPVAAALIAKLKSRQASAILSEMPAPVAAEIGNLIVRKTDHGSASADASQGRSL